MYSIDASALIDGWRRYYPPDVMPTLWEKLDSLIVNGRMISIDEVKLELKRGGDELYDWVNARNNMFVSPTDGIQENVGRIVNRFQDFVPERVPDGIWADPYVIALAQSNNLTVVTGEKRVQSGRPRIPNICDALGVNCISLLDLIRQEKWRF